MTTGLPDAYQPDEVSGRSRSVALALALVAPCLGLHRFYTGHKKLGVLMLVTLGGLGIWWLYDLITLASGEFRDADGRLVRRWLIEDIPATHARSTREIEDLADQLDALREQVGEIAERLDFAERLLAQQRERNGLPRAKT